MRPQGVALEDQRSGEGVCAGAASTIPGPLRRPADVTVPAQEADSGSTAGRRRMGLSFESVGVEHLRSNIVNNVRKIAAGAALLGAVIGGGTLTAMALPANAATPPATEPKPI